MKTIKSIAFAAISLLIVFLVSCSSAPKDPQITYMEVFTQSATHYPYFGSSRTYYRLYDANRRCSKHGSDCFVVTKTDQIINTADRCDRCRRSWYAHEKK
jgi:hypothetical protein